MAQNQPRGREKHVTDNGKDVQRRGEGLGTGPVGNRGRNGISGSPVAGGRPGSSGRASGGSYNSYGSSSSGGRRSPLLTIIVALVVLFGGGSGALSLLNGGDSGSTSSAYYTTAPTTQVTSTPAYSTATPSLSTAAISSLLNGQGTGSTWNAQEATGKLDTTVAAGTRARYTTIKGNGKDVTTILVYMCGTDLESKSGMATRDLQEMAAASFDSHINLIIYTGGCTGWKVSGISNQVNQIYQIKDGQMIRLESDMGNKSMTDPATLTEFLRYGSKNFPANRYDLILWDHGGGSVSGYGYDQKFSSSGSMNLSGINKALYDSGLKFDFIGFDACLMATAETALMLDSYTDYLIASEETEPGIGWYYTDWLTAYGKDPSMATLSLGKLIVDGYTEQCAKRCSGQLTTLSVIDVAEFANTVPEALRLFAEDTSEMIRADEYAEIATARQNTREFAQSSRIDQCDLVDLALRMDTEASRALADALLSAIKYNRTSSNMTNAYGVSVYFPNRKLSSVDRAVSIDSAIGMDSEFGDCIKAYASLQLSGQTVASSASSAVNPYASLWSATSGSSSGSSTASSTAGMEMATELLNLLFGGSTGSSSSASSFSSAFLRGRALTAEETASYITAHQFDSSLLEWQMDVQGNAFLTLPAEQWSLVTAVDQNMFFDDGSGYIDLGCDNLFSLDENGTLTADTDGTWLAINGQPVAYYHLTTVDDGVNYSITGYVPALLNGERVQLYVVFDNENPYGIISGYRFDYKEETEVIAKADNALQVGDVLDFVCDYYSYDGTYLDSYYLGESMTVTETMEISNVALRGGTPLVTYKFTDIYGQDYWTPVLP